MDEVLRAALQCLSHFLTPPFVFLCLAVRLNLLIQIRERNCIAALFQHFRHDIPPGCARHIADIDFSFLRKQERIKQRRILADDKQVFMQDGDKMPAVMSLTPTHSLGHIQGNRRCSAQLYLSWQTIC
jgi:hypothetical protein